MNESKSQLKQIIFKLKSELEDFEMEKAEQQLTGYVHAKRGYDIESLVSSMGLTEKEWLKIRFDAKSLGLNEREINEVDEYFK